MNMMGPYKRGLFELVPWALLKPVFWILHSIAAYKALWQLITRPHYWEKTEHGTSRFAAPHADEGGHQDAAPPEEPVADTDPEANLTPEEREERSAGERHRRMSW
jgi:hypothetical protein